MVFETNLIYQKGKPYLHVTSYKKNAFASIKVSRRSLNEHRYTEALEFFCEKKIDELKEMELPYYIELEAGYEYRAEALAEDKSVKSDSGYVRAECFITVKTMIKTIPSEKDHKIKVINRPKSDGTINIGDICYMVGERPVAFPLLLDGETKFAVPNTTEIRLKTMVPRIRLHIESMEPLPNIGIVPSGKVICPYCLNKKKSYKSYDQKERLFRLDPPEDVKCSSNDNVVDYANLVKNRYYNNCRTPKDKSIEEFSEEGGAEFEIDKNNRIKKITDKYGNPTQAVCPLCRKKLPDGAGWQKMAFISVIGASFSGKTVFLAEFDNYLNKFMKKEFGHTVLADIDTREYFNGVHDKIGNNERLVATKEIHTLIWQIDPLKEGGLILTAYDTPGELFRNGIYKDELYEFISGVLHVANLNVYITSIEQSFTNSNKLIAKKPTQLHDIFTYFNKDLNVALDILAETSTIFLITKIDLLAKKNEKSILHLDTMQKHKAAEELLRIEEVGLATDGKISLSKYRALSKKTKQCIEGLMPIEYSWLKQLGEKENYQVLAASLLGNRIEENAENYLTPIRAFDPMHYIISQLGLCKRLEGYDDRGKYNE